MEDWPDDGSPPKPPPTLRPLFVAVLIVVACAALAVWTLRNPYGPPPAPEPEATAPPTPTATRRAAAVPTRTPSSWVVPTLPPTAAPTAAPTAVPTAVATQTPVTAPPTATPVPIVPGTPREQPSLRNLAPPRVKKGSTTLIDVRGKGLRADLRAIVLRGGKVPREIAVPRQRFVDGTLIQVLIIVSPGASKGEYDVSVADVEGRRSNSVKLEVIQ
jgi:hypothetical protein